MKAILTVIAALAVGAADSPKSADDSAAPVVVELFTSQSCSSCVAAAEYFEELASREGVVALGWHVDYWNALETRKGRWVDPYSDAAYTDRQQRYNQKLRGTGGVYTPQIVVNGAAEAIGSDRVAVNALIGQKRKSDIAQITAMKRGSDGGVSFQASGAGEVSVVYFKPESKTSVRGGENAGRAFNDVNIVTDVAGLGAVTGRASFRASAPKDGEHCAILVQAPNQGRILAAQYCARS